MVLTSSLVKLHLEQKKKKRRFNSGRKYKKGIKNGKTEYYTKKDKYAKKLKFDKKYYSKTKGYPRKIHQMKNHGNLPKNLTIRIVYKD